ncbi:hypothetical protein TBR22_A52210 [Luteitalea sp. TBR-22]|uniref:hypothetical protein n=1 Tax=Luteitalea sp. TBR-22 TaxID=2802971 RepID=UPI001AFB3562|nr:hypothetical protein [Luteitalea sp. TBR-22]BCS35984.1 hypothetical protein TBR22_A52210 [Luteitalea sp. TBR-22]
MCLDPRPERTPRFARASRRPLQSHSPLHAAVPRLAHATLPVTVAAPIVRPPALWALDTLAGDDDLVARGWVVLSRTGQ